MLQGRGLYQFSGNQKSVCDSSPKLDLPPVTHFALAKQHSPVGSHPHPHARIMAYGRFEERVLSRWAPTSPPLLPNPYDIQSREVSREVIYNEPWGHV